MSGAATWSSLALAPPSIPRQPGRTLTGLPSHLNSSLAICRGRTSWQSRSRGSQAREHRWSSLSPPGSRNPTKAGQVICSAQEAVPAPSSPEPIPNTDSSSDQESGDGSPRRTIGVQFTCNKCQQQTTRYVNPHALTKGTVFLKCAGCDALHKFVDNLGLIEEINYKDEASSKSNGT